MNNTTNLSSLIWSSADDVLRGIFKPSEYGRIILPFVVLRRLDCVLEPKKDETYDLYESYKEKITDPSPIIKKQIGLPFFNRSRYDLSRIKSDPTNVLINFNNYIQGYSQNVFDIIENFQINPLVEKLQKNKRLYLLIDKFTEFDLHPDIVDNHHMGSVYEELLRKFSEMTNEESGDHFTPRDIVKLLVSLVFSGDEKNLQGDGKIRSVFDPCCGTGGLLTIGKEWVHDNINPNLKIELYGQELNDSTYAICKSDLLMLGENPENIHGPCSSISEDRLQGKKFDYMITNPPFGVSWKSEKEFVQNEAKDINGRFSVGIPRSSDGSFLFLLHLIKKMEPTGSRIGIIFNGSTCFTGDSGSGESNIRKWLIEKDLIETIVRLPDQLFFNTPLTTYIWIVSNKKQESKKNKITLIDGVEYFDTLKKSLGNKNKIIREDHIQKIMKVYFENKESENCKVVNSSEFGHKEIQIDFPLEATSKKTIKPDISKRIYERIPLHVDDVSYFEQNKHKFPSGYYMNSSNTKIGYEIVFNKYFSEFEKPLSQKTIRDSLKNIEKQISTILENEL
jgi:type I restriction enzyme M protein